MSSLGDVIHTLPLVRVLKKYIKSAEIDWVVNEEYTILLNGNPDINEIIPFRRRDWLSFFGFFKHRKEIKNFATHLKKKHYDVVIDVQGLFKSAIVVAMASGKRTLGFENAREFSNFLYDEKIKGDYSKHAVERYLQFAESLGIKWNKEDLFFHIPSKDIDRENLKKKLNSLSDKNIVVFCPFTRWETKVWDEENFHKLEELLESLDLEIVWIGSKNEKLKKDVKNNFIGVFNLLELYELMKISRFVVTCDSGAMHLASCANANIFALFGPTSDIRTGPYNLKGKNYIIKKSNLECAPCFDKACKRNDKACMSFSAEEVFDIIKASGLV